MVIPPKFAARSKALFVELLFLLVEVDEVGSSCQALPCLSEGAGAGWCVVLCLQAASPKVA